MVQREGGRPLCDETHRWELREVARRTVVDQSASLPVALAPSGKVVVSGYLNCIRGLRLPDLKQIWELPTSSRVYPSQNPSFSDSEMVLGLESTVTFYRLGDGTAPVPIRSFLVPASIDRCIVTPDSERMAIYDNREQQLSLYDCSGSGSLIPRRRQPLMRAAGGFAGLTFDPSSRWLAYAGQDQQGLVVVDRDGRPAAQMQAPDRISTLYACHRSLLFAAREDRLLLGSYAGVEQIDWRRATSNQLVSKRHWVGGLVPSPEGNLLALADHGGLVVYGLAEGEELACLAELPLQVFSLEFVPDSSRLVVGILDTAELMLLELVERAVPARSREQGPAWELLDEFNWHFGSVTWERFDSDAANPGFRTSTVTPELCLASAGGDRWALADGWNDVRVVGPRGKLLESIAVPSEGDLLRYEAVALSPSGRRLAAARRHSLYLWDLESGEHEARTGYSNYYRDRTHALRYTRKDQLWWASTQGLQRVAGRGSRDRQVSGHSLEGAFLEEDYALLVTRGRLHCQDLAARAPRWQQPLPDPNANLATSPARVALLMDGVVQVLQASDGARLLRRVLLSVPRSLAALGFLGDRWLLVQWEDRTNSGISRPTASSIRRSGAGWWPAAGRSPSSFRITSCGCSVSRARWLRNRWGRPSWKQMKDAAATSPCAVGPEGFHGRPHSERRRYWRSARRLGMVFRR